MTIPQPGQTQIFDYTKLIGGVNYRVADSMVSEDPENMEFADLQNVDMFKTGSLTSVSGNTQINGTDLTDTTKVLGIGQFITPTKTYVMYTKASGKCYALDITGTTETLIKSGLSTLQIPTFVEFNGKVIMFNGYDAPFSWDGTIVHTLTGVPAAWTGTTQPNYGGTLNGHLVTCLGNIVYGCALSNENDWTTASDSFALSNPFNDVTYFTAIAEYGQSLTIHSAKRSIYLLTGQSTGTVPTLNVTRIASNRSATVNTATAQIDRYLFFYGGNCILPVKTTEFGIQMLDFDTDILFKLKSLTASGEINPIGQINRQVINPTCILLPFYDRDQLWAYFQSISSSGLYDICAIFDLKVKGWSFRTMIPITAAAMIQDQFVITGIVDGKILKENTGSVKYDNSVITKRVLTPWLRSGAPALKKRHTHFWLYITSQVNSNITINVRQDYNDAIVNTYTFKAGSSTAARYGLSSYGIGTYGGALVDDLIHWSPEVTGNVIQYEILNSDPDTIFAIRNFSIEVEYQDQGN